MESRKRNTSPDFVLLFRRRQWVPDSEPALDCRNTKVEQSLVIKAFADLLAELLDFRAGRHGAVDCAEFDLDIAAALACFIRITDLLLCCRLQKVEVGPGSTLPLMASMS